MEGVLKNMKALFKKLYRDICLVAIGMNISFVVIAVITKDPNLVLLGSASAILCGVGAWHNFPKEKEE